MSRSVRPNVAIAFVDDEAFDPQTIHTTLDGRGRWLLAASTLALLAIVPGLFAVRGGWLFLDVSTITQNPILRSWSGLSYLWMHPHAMPEFSPAGYSAYLVEYRFFTDHVLSYRLFNLLLHALTSIALWTLLRKLIIPGAWVAAALFATHPIQVDTVAWVAQQPRMFSAIAMIVSLLLFLRCAEISQSDPADDSTPARFLHLPNSPIVLYIASLNLAFASMFFDASGATVGVIALLLILWKRGQVTRRDWHALTPMLVGGAVVLILNVSTFAAGDASDWVSPSFLVRLQLPGGTFIFYLLSSIGVGRWNFVYPLWQLQSVAPATLRFVAGATLIAALIILWRSRSRIGRAPFTALAIFVALLVPWMGWIDFAWMRQSFVADHFAYLPLAVVMTALSALVARFVSDVRLRAAIAIILLSATITLAATRATFYRDQKRLWNRVLESDPHSIIAHNNLGRELLDDDHDVTSAMFHFTEALRLDPRRASTRLNLAAGFEATRDFDQAVAQYYAALRDRPQLFDAHFGLAGALERQGDTTAALNEYKIAGELRPADARVPNNVGLIFYQLGKTDEAIADFRRAISLDERFSVARLNLARAYFEHANYADAADQLKAILAYDPQNFEAYYTIGAILESTGDIRNAERYLHYAVSLQPHSTLAYRHLASVLEGEATGETRNKSLIFLNEAIVCLRKVTKLNPDDMQAASEADWLVGERDRMAATNAEDRYTPNIRHP